MKFFKVRIANKNDKEKIVFLIVKASDKNDAVRKVRKTNPECEIVEIEYMKW